MCLQRAKLGQVHSQGEAAVRFETADTPNDGKSSIEQERRWWNAQNKRTEAKVEEGNF